MKCSVHLATHNIGKGLAISGTEDPSEIHRIIGEGIVGLMTDSRDGFVEIYINDGAAVRGYSLTVAQALGSNDGMLFKAVRI
ncbi:MAG: hypothetical protein JWN50_775 [Parcubacteria group bacterium]|nr:hypothetical protein [Parcubacteria group bacterium]